MREIVLKGKGAARGLAEGKALVIEEAVSFLSDIDVNTGRIVNPKSTSKGKSCADKIMIFPTGRGSTADPYGFYLLVKGGKGPKAVVNVTANPTTVAGAIISGTPMVYQLEKNPLEIVQSGDQVRVDGDQGVLVVMK